MRLSAVVLFFFVFGGAFAQQSVTVYDAVTSRAGVHSHPVMVEDGHQGNIVIYKTRQPGTGYVNLSYQRLNASGDPMTSGGAKSVCPVQAHQYAHSVIADGAGGCFVVWEDLRFGVQNERVFAQRLNAKGEAVWPPAGVLLARKTCRQQNPKAILDGKGGLYVFWEDYRNKNNDADVYGQHLNDKGFPLWEEDGRKVVSALGGQKNISLVASADRSVIVLWEDSRHKVFTAVYGQLVDFNGFCKWFDNGVPVAQKQGFNIRNPSACADGFGGMLCVYETSGQNSLKRDVVLSRINRQGQSVYEKTVCDAFGDQVSPQIVSKGQEAMIFWEDHRYGNADVFGQKMDVATGNPAWQPQGAPICTEKGDQKSPAFVAASLRGDQIIAWTDYRNGNPDIFAQKVDRLGQALWPAAGLEVCAGPQKQLHLSCTNDGKGGAWLIWIDENKEHATQVSIQHVNKDGKASFRPEPRIVVGSDDVGYARIDNLLACRGKNAEIYLVWDDYRAGKDNSDVYIQRLDHEGRPVWRYGGLPVVKAPSYQNVSKIIPYQGGVVVGWLDRRNLNDDLFIQYIDSTGAPVWQTNGVPVCAAERTQNNLQLSVLPNGDILAVWTDARALYETGFDLYMQVFNSKGKISFPENGKPFTTDKGYQLNCTVVGDKDGGTYVAWMDDRYGEYCIVGQRLGNKGVLEWATPGVKLAQSKGHQRFPIAVKDGADDVYFAWTDDRFGHGYTQIVMQKLTPDGKKLWDGAGRVVAENMNNQTAPRLAPLPSSGTLLTWLEQPDDSLDVYHLVAQRIDSRGKRFWDPIHGGEGVRVGIGLQENAWFDAGAGFDNRAYYVWPQTDKKSGKRQIYYAELSLGTGNIFRKAKLNCAANADCYRPNFVPLEDGSIMTAWVEKHRPGEEYRLKAQRIHSDDYKSEAR
mgnify:CR=1 FL=1